MRGILRPRVATELGDPNSATRTRKTRPAPTSGNDRGPQHRLHRSVPSVTPTEFGSSSAPLDADEEGRSDTWGCERMHDEQGGQRGAVLVEFALVVTFLCLVVFGTISFGILLGYRQNLTQAATEAARAASVQQNEGDQVTAALAAATSALDELDHRCSTTPQ